MRDAALSDPILSSEGAHPFSSLFVISHLFAFSKKRRVFFSPTTVDPSVCVVSVPTLDPGGWVICDDPCPVSKPLDWASERSPSDSSHPDALTRLQPETRSIKLQFLKNEARINANTSEFPDAQCCMFALLFEPHCAIDHTSSPPGQSDGDRRCSHAVRGIRILVGTHDPATRKKFEHCLRGAPAKGQVRTQEVYTTPERTGCNQDAQERRTTGTTTS